jgi:hypothetical protein
VYYPLRAPAYGFAAIIQLHAHPTAPRQCSVCKHPCGRAQFCKQLQPERVNPLFLVACMLASCTVTWFYEFSQHSALIVPGSSTLTQNCQPCLQVVTASSQPAVPAARIPVLNDEMDHPASSGPILLHASGPPPSLKSKVNTARNDRTSHTPTLQVINSCLLRSGALPIVLSRNSCFRERGDRSSYHLIGPSRKA